MKHAIAIATGLLFVALTCTGTGSSQQATHTYTTLQEKIGALKGLRDSGVLTEQEYEAKVRELQAGAQPSTRVAALAPAGVAQAGAAQAGTIAWPGTRTVEAGDPVYQTTAYTLDVPANWKYAGTIARGNGCHDGGPGLKITAQSADGLFQIVQLPAVKWHWAADAQSRQFRAQRCPDIDIDSAAGFLVNVAVPNVRPNAKIVAVLYPTPEMKQVLDEQMEIQQQQNEELARQYNAKPHRLIVDGARVRIQYEVDGQPVEEMITAIVNCSTMALPVMGHPRWPNYDDRTCFSRGTSFVRAPLGQLDALLALPQYREMIKSARPNQEWQTRLNDDLRAQSQRQMAQQNAATQQMIAASNAAFQARMQANQALYQNMAANNQAFNANLQASTDRSIANARASQNALDASAHQTVLYALDQKEYTNPYNGQTVAASNKFAQQWISSDGQYVAGSNTGANPNDYVGPTGPTFAPLIPH